MARKRQKPMPFSSGLNSGCWVVLYCFRVVAMNQCLEPAGCVLSTVNMDTQKEATLCRHTEPHANHSGSFWDTHSGRHRNLVCLQFSLWRMCDVAVPIALSAKIGVAMAVRSLALRDGWSGVVLDNPLLVALMVWYSVWKSMPRCVKRLEKISPKWSCERFHEAVIISIFTITVNVKGVVRSDEPPENYHLNLQLASALQSSIASFSLLSRLYCFQMSDNAP